MVANTSDVQVGVGDGYRYGFAMPENYTFKSRKGLDEQVVREISYLKSEPQWMTNFRVRALKTFEGKPMPQWGGWLNDIDFNDIFYFVRASDTNSGSWDEVPAEVKDTFDRLGIPEAEKKYLAGVGAQYECLSGDSRVYTARGLVPIKDVVPGDTVFSLDENTNQIIPARVKATAYKGERQVFEIRAGTRRIKATANHPFYMLNYRRESGKLRGRYSRGWEYLENLRVGDLVALSKNVPDTGVSHKLKQPELKLVAAGHNQVPGVAYDLDISNRYNAVALPEYTSEDLMWWLGLYMGDGYIHHAQGADKARIGIAIHELDPGLRSEAASVTQSLFGIAPTQQDADRLTINSTILARFLGANDFGGTALTKRIPRWVFGLPKSEKLAFLAGYIDSDGYVRDSQKNHDIMLTSGSEALLQDARDLAMLCGLSVSQIHRFESKHPHDKTCAIVGYRLQLSGNYDGLVCRSPRRAERLGKRKYHHNYSSAHNTDFSKHTGLDFGFGRVESIAPVGVEAVYDIEVDGPHNFVAEGFVVHNSEVVYHSLREDLQKLGVIFTDMDTAVRDYPDLVKQYFSTIIPTGDNKFAALNSAVWSGGSFVYVPSGVHVEVPLQAYFRINAQNMGQFERTLIIAEPGSYVHYVEGCTAPTYTTNSLHSAVVEIIVKEGARVRYTTIQNWSHNVYNLVTKRAAAYRDATMEWVDGNLGSKLTMKYPAVWLMEPGARGDVLSVAFAGSGQHQDAGAKMVHKAPHTTSNVVSKSISKGTGRATYRGLLEVSEDAHHCKANVKCDALLLDQDARSDTYPTINVANNSTTIQHEATVSKVGEDQLFYLMSRGISENEATAMVVNGFVEPITKEIPLEYAVELNRLIELQMEGSIG